MPTQHRMDTDSPYQDGSPWPCMRADVRNTGRSPLLHAGVAAEAAPPIRCWTTGNAIFSTPVIGADETVYVGSADKRFYAFDPVTGTQRWSFETGECIDSAGCIARDGTVYFVSCDAGLYGLGPDGEERWRLNLFENRGHFTPSTIFWWEGNVVLGPNGLLYAGNDDFNFYAIEAGKGVRWAYLTGLHIWAAPAFGPDGSVCVLSFDRNCYLFDRETGGVRWRTNTGNFVVSSPAIDDAGIIFFGSFDGHVYALDGGSGRVRWRTATAGPIYASPALAEDGVLYIGSSDCCLYAIDTARGRVVWSFYTGDAIRSSAAIGPDPENRAPYLVYFGSGNGILYCVDPDGRRRWSLRTVSEGNVLDSPNINASIALGRSGLAAATASGKVVYVPFRHYMSDPDDPLLDHNPRDGYPEAGLFLYSVAPGGSMSAEPTDAAAEPVVAEPSQPLSLRLLARLNGQTVPARLDPQDVEVLIDPPRPFRITLQPGGTQMNVVPEGAAPAAEEAVTVRARGRIGGQSAATVTARVPIRFLPAVDAPSIGALPDLPFRVTHMSVYDPPIVPSFDQIGIASLTMQVRIVRADEASGRVAAWGVEKFGFAADGEAVQVAMARHLFYAFGGTYESGRLVLTARDCAFELTAFPAPLDTLRLSGTWEGAEGPCRGSSLIAELDVAGRFRQLAGGSGGLARSARALARMTDLVRRWVPDSATAAQSLPLLVRFLARVVPLGVQMLRREMHGPWGLVGDDGWFRGIGSFRARADRPLDTAALEVRSFRYQPASHAIVAEIAARAGHESSLNTVVPGIAVVDTQGNEPAPLRYNTATEVKREPGRVSVELGLPPSVSAGTDRWCAYLMLDVTPLAELVF